VTLTVPIGPDHERAVRAARRWFELCPERLHGAFGAAVRAMPETELGQDDRRAGAVSATVSVAVWDGVHPEPWEWSEVYSPRSFGELLSRLGRLPDAAGFDASTLDDRGRWNRPGFHVGVVAEDDCLDLFSTIDDAVANDPDGERAILATLREVAELAAPLAVAVAVQGSQAEMPLEDAISRSNTTYTRSPATVLRNYGWLTVLSDEMADRVGGGGRLGAGGAFVEVERLAAGGWWLLATKTWDEYGPEQANRVFEAVAPLLPAGRPEMTRLVLPFTGEPYEVTRPNVVAERDPREITGHDVFAERGVDRPVSRRSPGSARG
jgi:hypothetical protein